MHRFVVAVLGATAMGVVSANAADMPIKAPPMAPMILTWTGFYAGVNLGGAWVNSDSNDFSDDHLAGVIGGGQLGYNWQTGALLLGVEGDFQGSSQHRSGSFIDPISGIAFDTEARIPWFATLRGRLGYANGPWLLYVTGGGAWVNVKETVSALGVEVSHDSTHSGWTVGGGVEWMFIPQWSAKLEYLYINAGHDSDTLFGDTFDAHARENVLRVGLNYHF